LAKCRYAECRGANNIMWCYISAMPELILLLYI